MKSYNAGCIATALILIGLASDAIAGGVWIADTNNCKIWDTNPKNNETLTWSGACQGGYAEGPGTLKWGEDGALSSTFEGSFSGGKRNGKGKETFAEGGSFDGEFVDDLPEGKGVMTFADGARYEGDFLDGKLEGKGTTVFANGSRYEGSYSNNKFNGEGKMQFALGGGYEGSWKAGAHDGAGTIFYRDGSRVDGIFPSGEMIYTAAKDWVDRPASLSAGNCTPTYSKAALDAKEEGTVRVQFEIDAYGKLLAAVIAKSSGFADLDRATINALSRCKFKPAIKDGKLTPTTLLTDYEWKPIPPKTSPIIAQLKDDEGVVLIDIMIVTSRNLNYPAALHKLPYTKASELWLKNMDTNKEYGGMFNSTKGEYGVAFVVVPEGIYCLDDFWTGPFDYPWCKGPQITVTKGVINNAGEWWFAKLNAPTGASRSVDFRMIGAQENAAATLQRAVNQHPELLEN